jgi:uncharacterized integral membrane protein (TIGR00697 family)
MPLSMLYLAFLTTSMILSYRFVNIGPILTVSSVFVIPFSYSISDIIAEVYGYDTIRKIIWNAFLAAAFIFVMLWLLTKLPASPKYDHFTESYNIVFGHSLRVFVSNCIGMFFGIFLNSYIIVKWKLLVKGKLFFIRTLSSSTIGEFLFTAIVVTLVQYNISSPAEIAEMIVVSFSMKLIFTLLSAITGAFFVKPLIEKIDGRDSFSAAKSYNPFKFEAAKE